MNKLLKDAIADAKAVRETALANAKAALEEAFAPKLQSMLSHKIKEEMEAEEEEEMEPAQDAAMEMERMQKNAGLVAEEDEEMPADEEGMEDEMPADEEGMEDDDLEFSIGGQEYEIEPVGGEEEMGGEEDMAGEEGEVSDEELAELIAELEGEDEEEMEEATELDPNSGKYDADAETMEEAEDPEAKEMDEEVNLEEIIAALKEGEDEEEEDEEEEEKTEAKKMKKMEEELNEAYSVVKFLRGKLSEVNLLNAKLLFVNKLFRKGNLSETQKVKVIETFDRAKNVREAKLIYATLAESMNTKSTSTKPVARKRMAEGLASAPQKSTKVITESNNVYERFKTLVNFNKQ